MNIYLIRHGDKMHDHKNHGLLELTEKGVIQADLLGQRLTKYNIQRIYSSPMKRAIQTAEIMNRHLGLEIMIRKELREIHMGAAEVKGWGYLEEQHPEFIKEYRQYTKDLRFPPDGESIEDGWIRARKVIDEVISTDLDDVALVAHGGLIKSIICGTLGIDFSRRFSFGLIENCGISLIEYNRESNRFRLSIYNDHSHLE
ncbi:MAG: histidine phosphatase family protein [Clostridiales bacterium]|nr:histidine phosphatase family protein [Clostridiales bacterium]